ncbi:MAG: amidohydrolase [Acidobacteriota bacterium]
MSQAPRSTPALAAALLVVALAPPGCSAPGDAGTAPADLVLRGGAVYTMDAVRSWAAAVAVRGERIVYVGPDNGVSPFVGPRTTVVELRGRMVLPGFQDAHIHPVSGGVGHLSCSLYGLKSREEYLAAVGEYARSHPDAAWIRGEGWTLDAFAPTGVPDGRLLDGIVPDRPVYLESSDGHSAWVNSRALELAGITRETPDPPGGRIDRDPQTGDPLGSLQDSAMDLVRDHAPPTSAAQRERGLRFALELLNGYGVTSFQDAHVDLDGEEPYRSLDTYRALDERGELTARVVASLWWDRERGEEQIPGLVAARRGYTRGRLRATAVKIMQDGVLEAQTAAVLEPYVGRPGDTGLAMIDPEALKRYVTLLDREGFQVHFHAIGDAAIRQCLDALEAARRANGARDSRHHISHIQLFHPDDIHRFRELGVVANFQPLWAYADDYIVQLTLPFLRPGAARWIYPIRSLVGSGAVVAFGSDWSVSSANPLEEIEVAVTRMDPDGGGEGPFIPEERIGLGDALAAFTIGAAYVNFQEDRTGSIEAGKLADLVVVDRNLFAVDPSEISEARVLLTLLGGKPVHGDLASLEGARPGRR